MLKSFNCCRQLKVKRRDLREHARTPHLFSEGASLDLVVFIIYLTVDKLLRLKMNFLFFCPFDYVDLSGNFPHGIHGLLPGGRMSETWVYLNYSVVIHVFPKNRAHVRGIGDNSYWTHLMSMSRVFIKTIVGFRSISHGFFAEGLRH